MGAFSDANNYPLGTSLITTLRWRPVKTGGRALITQLVRSSRPVNMRLHKRLCQSLPNGHESGSASATLAARKRLR
jgi:hypothetical protein